MAELISFGWFWKYYAVNVDTLADLVVTIKLIGSSRERKNDRTRE